MSLEIEYIALEEEIKDGEERKAKKFTLMGKDLPLYNRRGYFLRRVHCASIGSHLS